MCKVLNICSNDWANFAYDNYQALLSVGVDAKAIKFRPHVNGYNKECEIVTNDKDIQSIVDDADIVQVFHSDESVLPFIKGKKVIVYHAGSKYRNNVQYHNDIWNPVVWKSLLALGEFWDLGAKNQEYIVGAIDTNRLKPDYLLQDKRTFAHHPSNVRKKGTAAILSIMQKMVRKYKVNFNGFHVKLVASEANLDRIRQCDIYIELYQPMLDGHPYGSWGITAMEAAALGKVVITNHTTHKLYESNYGHCFVYRANTIAELKQAIFRCAKISNQKLLDWQHDTRESIEKYHSYKSTGERLIKLYGL